MSDGPVEIAVLRRLFEAEMDAAPPPRKFTRRMAIHIADDVGRAPMELIALLEDLRILPAGSHRRFVDMGGISPRQIIAARIERMGVNETRRVW